MCCFTWYGPGEPHWECHDWQWPGGSDGEWTMRVHGEEISGEAWGRRLLVLRHRQRSDCIWHSGWTGSAWKWLYRKQELWGLRLSAFRNIWIDELKTNKNQKLSSVRKQEARKRECSGSQMKSMLLKKRGNDQLCCISSLLLSIIWSQIQWLGTKYTYYLTVSMGQESEHRLARLSVSETHEAKIKVLARMHSHPEAQ